MRSSVIIHALVSKVNKSSVATEKILSRCSKKLMGDCPTRWSSTFIMIECLLDVKEPLKAEEPGEYSVLKLFVQYTLLNSGDEYTAMCCVVPSVMELNLHLEDMKKSLKLNTLHHISKLS